MRVAVIGYSGSGKSTLAKYLGEKFQIPVLHLDRVHWLPGWQERSRAESAEIVKQFLDEHKSWVIDGTYSALEYERRLKEADTIVLMDFRRLSCFFRDWKRYVQNRGRTRDSMGEGCVERMNREFIWWLLHRKKSQKERYRKVLEQYGYKTAVIRSQKELDKWMKEFVGNC